MVRSLTRARLVVPLVLGLTGVVFAVPAAGAATFTPTRFDDPTPNGCNPADCSLREAIIAANAAAGPDTVVLAGGTYSLSILGTDEDAAADGDLDVTEGLTVTGVGRDATIIDGNGVVTTERVFDIDPLGGGSAVPVTFRDLTIRGGRALDTFEDGGGIWSHNMGQVTLDSVAVKDNQTESEGGGVFSEDDGSLSITNSVISGNESLDNGGGISNWNNASMTMTNTIVMGNRAGDGGGIHSRNTLNVTISDSIFTGNIATNEGGGIHNFNEIVLTVTDTTISGNTAGDEGGGTHIRNEVQATFINSTISSNTSQDHGGGMHLQNFPTVSVENVTIAGNTSDSESDGTGDGGGVAVDPAFTGTLNLKNTLVGDNTDASPAAGTVHPDCSAVAAAPVTSQGHNLIENTTGCSITGTATGNITGQDPQLGPLADNGGPTQTHALLAGSPAIDAGNPATPGSGGTSCAANDQRGLTRNCDIGAYELVLCAAVPVNRIGTPGDDALTGTDDSDGFLAGDGNDTAAGLGGDDAICLEGGDDTGSGGDGNDWILGAPGIDAGDGGDGNDTFLGGDGNDRGKGGAGKDLLKGEKGKDRLNGGSGKDKLLGGGGKDRLNCGGGKKEVGKGGPGKDKAVKCEKGKV